MSRIPRYTLAPALLVAGLFAILVGLSFVPVPVQAHGNDRHFELLLRLLTSDSF